MKMATVHCDLKMCSYQRCSTACPSMFDISQNIWNSFNVVKFLIGKVKVIVIGLRLTKIIISNKSYLINR